MLRRWYARVAVQQTLKLCGYDYLSDVILSVFRTGLFLLPGRVEAGKTTVTTPAVRFIQLGDTVDRCRACTVTCPWIATEIITSLRYY